MAMNTWLEPELKRELCEVAAPPELWSRVQSARLLRPRESRRGLVWATAATMILATVALSRMPAGENAAVNDTQPIGLRCQNPAQIRAWEVARATDVSAAASPSAVTGPRFTLAGNNSAALQLSCKLCHLD